jgi:hypothetical protein
MAVHANPVTLMLNCGVSRAHAQKRRRFDAARLCVGVSSLCAELPASARLRSVRLLPAADSAAQIVSEPQRERVSVSPRALHPLPANTTLRACLRSADSGSQH